MGTCVRAVVCVVACRGDYYPATRSEYESIKAQLEYEKTGDGQSFHDLPPLDQAARVKARMKTYCQRVSGWEHEGGGGRGSREQLHGSLVPHYCASLHQVKRCGVCAYCVRVVVYRCVCVFGGGGVGSVSLAGVQACEGQRDV